MENILSYLDKEEHAFIYFAVKLVIILAVLAISLRILGAVFRRTRANMESRGRYTGHLNFIRYSIMTGLYAAAIIAALSEVPGMSSVLTSILAGSGIIAVVIGIALSGVDRKPCKRPYNPYSAAFSGGRYYKVY